VLFNCSTVASGPIRELQMFRRLLDDGVRPDWLFVEVWTPYLTQRDCWFEETYIRKADLQLRDWRTLDYIRADKWQLWSRWLETQLAPAIAFREPLLRQTAPDLLPQNGARNESWYDPNRRHQEDGWLDPPDPPPQWRADAWEPRWWKMKMHLACDPFEVYPPADRALRELLGLAREKGIAVCLLLCPEHSVGRGPAGMLTWSANTAYLEALSREYGAPVIDTRDWVADAEFTDYFHAASTATVPYTRRFSEEVLSPLLAGKPLAPAVLLPTSSATTSAGGRPLSRGLPAGGFESGRRSAAAGRGNFAEQDAGQIVIERLPAAVQPFLVACLGLISDANRGPGWDGGQKRSGRSSRLFPLEEPGKQVEHGRIDGARHGRLHREAKALQSGCDVGNRHISGRCAPPTDGAFVFHRRPHGRSPLSLPLPHHQASGLRCRAREPQRLPSSRLNRFTVPGPMSPPQGQECHAVLFV
jgi:hypothetical protein